MESEFQSFRRETRADIQLTQGLLRNTIRRLERQEQVSVRQSAILEQHSQLLEQQSQLLEQQVSLNGQQRELTQSLMKYQLEGIQEFRKMEKAIEKLGNTLDAGLKNLEDRLDAA